MRTSFGRLGARPGSARPAFRARHARRGGASGEIGRPASPCSPSRPQTGQMPRLRPGPVSEQQGPLSDNRLCGVMAAPRSCPSALLFVGQCPPRTSRITKHSPDSKPRPEHKSGLRSVRRAAALGPRATRRLRRLAIETRTRKEIGGRAPGPLPQRHHQAVPVSGCRSFHRPRGHRIRGRCNHTPSAQPRELLHTRLVDVTWIM